MPSFKKETVGAATVWTLRNTKGNELKVTNAGARLVSMRFRDKSFTNRFMIKDDAEAGIVFVDGGKDFANILWQAEETIEGLKLYAQVGDKSAVITYSVSNDNEISIKYEAAGVDDISTQVVFSAEALPDAHIRACQKDADWEKIADAKTYPVTQPAEVEMELGMFGYDPGCPINYLDAGLKNAANVRTGDWGVEVIVYATQDAIHAQTVDGGFALKTSGSKAADGKICGQTVYMIKSR